MNKTLLIGRLVRDPELNFTNNGVPVAKFTLAVDRPFKNQNGEREADFIRIVVWRKLAEICANNLGKGRLVAILGRIETSSWKNEQDQWQNKTEVVADEVKFLDYPKDRDEEFPGDLSKFDEMPGVPF